MGWLYINSFVIDAILRGTKSIIIIVIIIIVIIRCSGLLRESDARLHTRSAV